MSSYISSSSISKKRIIYWDYTQNYKDERIFWTMKPSGQDKVDLNTAGEGKHQSTKAPHIPILTEKV